MLETCRSRAIPVRRRLRHNKLGTPASSRHLRSRMLNMHCTVSLYKCHRSVMSTFGVEHAASYAESTDRFLVHGSGTIPAFRVLAEPVEHDEPRSAAGSCGFCGDARSVLGH